MPLLNPLQVVYFLLTKSLSKTGIVHFKLLSKQVYWKRGNHFKTAASSKTFVVNRENFRPWRPAHTSFEHTDNTPSYMWRHIWTQINIAKPGILAREQEDNTSFSLRTYSPNCSNLECCPITKLTESFLGQCIGGVAFLIKLQNMRIPFECLPITFFVIYAVFSICQAQTHGVFFCLRARNNEVWNMIFRS